MDRIHIYAPNLDSGDPRIIVALTRYIEGLNNFISHFAPKGANFCILNVAPAPVYTQDSPEFEIEVQYARRNGGELSIVGESATYGRESLPSID